VEVLLAPLVVEDLLVEIPLGCEIQISVTQESRVI
jgi:hypothetical protein